MRAPRRTDAAVLPGMLSVSRGIIADPVTALFAASGAAMPSMLPSPNSSGCFDDFFAVLYAI